MSRLRTNSQQVRALADLAAQLRVRPGALPELPAGIDPETEARLWLVITGICQQTRHLRGEIDGQPLRGSDYLVATLARDAARRPERWTAAALATWSSEELRAAVSDAGDPSTSTLDRIDERLTQLRDMGAQLEARWRGSALTIHRRSDARVASLLAMLREFDAYRDPIEKKSHLLLIFLHERGLWPLADPEHLEIAVDYHVMRVALRVGLVEVLDPALRRALIENQPVDETRDSEVRSAVRDACQEVLGRAAISPFALDHLLWTVGRTCCFPDHPVSADPEAPPFSEKCSSFVLPADLAALRCPLEPVCLAARDPEQRRLRETNFDSPHY